MILVGVWNEEKGPLRHRVACWRVVGGGDRALDGILMGKLRVPTVQNFIFYERGFALYMTTDK